MSEWWSGFIWGAIGGWALTSVGSFFVFALFFSAGQSRNSLDKRIKDIEEEFKSYR